MNPAIVRGQVEGGIVQGIGGALTEELGLRAAGRPRGATLFDYVLPVADDVPPLAIELFETPSPVTPTGARGAGEIGIIGPVRRSRTPSPPPSAASSHAPSPDDPATGAFALASTAREQRDLRDPVHS